MRVGHEVDEGALKTSTLTSQNDKAACSKLAGALGIDDAQVGAKIPVRLHLEALGLEVARGAPTTNLGVVVLVLADGRGFGRDVRDTQQDVVQLLVDCLALGSSAGKLVLDLGNASLGGLGFLGFLLSKKLTDLLRDGIALGLKGLFLHDCLTTLFVKARESLFVEGSVLALGSSGNFLEILANIAKV